MDTIETAERLFTIVKSLSELGDGFVMVQQRPKVSMSSDEVFCGEFG